MAEHRDIDKYDGYVIATRIIGPNKKTQYTKADFDGKINKYIFGIKGSPSNAHTVTQNLRYTRKFRNITAKGKLPVFDPRKYYVIFVHPWEEWVNPHTGRKELSPLGEMYWDGFISQCLSEHIKYKEGMEDARRQRSRNTNRRRR